MRLTLVAVVAVFVLIGCASDPAVRWAQAQTTYNETAKAMVLYRAPCIDPVAYANAGPTHPLCRIDGATWAVVYPVMQEADRCLKAADVQLQGGGSSSLEDALSCGEAALERLILYRLSVQGD